jgi:hypothetical protein
LRSFVSFRGVLPPGMTSNVFSRGVLHGFLQGAPQGCSTGYPPVVNFMTFSSLFFRRPPRCNPRCPPRCHPRCPPRFPPRYPPGVSSRVYSSVSSEFTPGCPPDVLQRCPPWRSPPPHFIYLFLHTFTAGIWLIFPVTELTALNFGGRAPNTTLASYKLKGVD